jgi:signal peptidase I
VKKVNKDFTHFEIYPLVSVYRGLLPEVSDLYRIVKESEKDAGGRYYLRKWDQWSVFGTYSQQKHHANEERELGIRYDEEKKLADSTYEAYNIAIDDYVKRNEISLPEDARLLTSSFSKYNADTDLNGNGLSMNYHTDFVMSEADMPGPKFLLTCTTYLNDDYDGGEIEFYIDGQSEEIYSHKPQAGDIVVFPSRAPYYHGVGLVKGNDKFFIRNFIQYTFDGTQEWLDNQKRYGAYRWAAMEKERVDSTNHLYMKYPKGAPAGREKEINELYKV